MLRIIKYRKIYPISMCIVKQWINVSWLRTILNYTKKNYSEIWKFSDLIVQFPSKLIKFECCSTSYWITNFNQSCRLPLVQLSWPSKISTWTPPLSYRLIKFSLKRNQKRCTRQFLFVWCHLILLHSLQFESQSSVCR